MLRVGDSYVAVESADGGIVVRQASSLDGLASAPAKKVWSDTGESWERVIGDPYINEAPRP